MTRSISVISRLLPLLCSLTFLTLTAHAQDAALKFGSVQDWQTLANGSDSPGTTLEWINVNTENETWTVADGVLKCKGQPIGVMRSSRQFENFILHIEWMHLEAGGNSGLFVWSDARPGEHRLPNGVEVQMLELDWVNLNKRDNQTPPVAYVHGELFGVGGVETTPDNPRGSRSKSLENLCLGKGEWNTYDVIAVDGTIKLSVNGKFVNGISRASQKKGYICFESEGAPIEFRNLSIVELPPGVTTNEQTAPTIE